MPTPTSGAPDAGRPMVSLVVRSVALMDFLLGLGALAIGGGYLYLRSENFRMSFDGHRVGETGVFFAIAVNARSAADLLGLGGIPGGGQNDIPGTSTIRLFGSARMLDVFAGLSTAYLALGVAWIALADGLARGARWARRSQGVAGWLGLGLVSGYAALYLLSEQAPRLGLIVVAVSALVPASMVWASRSPFEAPATSPGDRPGRLGLPGWVLIGAGLLVVSMWVHLILAWWILLGVKASM